MLVFASHDRVVPTRSVAATAARLAEASSTLESARELLIAAGALEVGIADALSAECDELRGSLAALRRLVVGTGAMLAHAWDGRTHANEAGRAREGVLRALDRLRADPPVASIRLRVAEGFAFYALFPEAYLEAARRFARERRPPSVFVLGLRSIGASLSGAVTAALHAEGIAAGSWTARPRGEPFDRRLVLGPALARALAGHAARGGHLLVVDEGPGLSGSSFAAATEAGTRAGFPDDRITILPSWAGDPTRFRNRAAAARWLRHPRVCASFEETLLRGGRLFEAIGVEPRADLAAGKWRRSLIGPGRAWPAADPRYERRKWLARDPADGALVVVEFVGFGERGRAGLARARLLHEARLGPAPRRLAHGFLVRRFVAGRLRLSRGLDRTLGLSIARLAATLARAQPASGTVPFERLAELIATNAGETLGTDAGARARDELARWRERVTDRAAIAADGCMFPWKWVEAASGWRKIDALDHHDGHFLPGATDIAWDLAAAAEEIAGNPIEERALLQEFECASGDRNVRAVLPFHRLAWLALRAGRARLGESAPGADGDPARWRAESRRLERRLAEALDALPRVSPSRAAVARPGRAIVPSGVRLIVFDADDTLRRTIVPGLPCPHDDGDWILLPGVAETLRALPIGDGDGIGARVRIGVASNQDHVGYGLLTAEKAHALIASMLATALGRPPDGALVRICPHPAHAGCDCRKPAPGMLLDIARTAGVPPAHALFVGDAESDRQAADRAGLRFRYADEFFSRSSRGGSGPS